VQSWVTLAVSFSEDVFVCLLLRGGFAPLAAESIGLV
jgi:hypothetical protein